MSSCPSSQRIIHFWQFMKTFCQILYNNTCTHISGISFKTILKFPYAILACIFFSRVLKRLTHSLPDKTFISTAKNARTACFFAVLESTFF